MKNTLSKEEELLLEISSAVVSNREFNSNSFENINWNIIYNLLNDHKLFSVLYPRLKPYIPSHELKKFHINDVLFKNSRSQYLEELREVISGAKENGLNLTIIKGVSLSYFIYNDLLKRDYDDMDILIPVDQLERGGEFVSRMGYQICSEGFFPIPEPPEKTVGLFHEYWYLKKINYFKHICLELKIASSAISVQFIDEFIRHSETINLGNFQITTFDLHHSFIHLFANVFVNSETHYGDICLRDYVDLALFLSKYKEVLDWEQIKSLGDKYMISHKLFCVLNNLKELFPDFSHGVQINRFNPINNNYRYNGTPQGGFVNWQSSFLDRLFNRESRMCEFQTLLIENSYSVNNPNFNKPVAVLRDHEVDISSSKQFNDIFAVGDKQINFKYLFSLNKESFYIYLFLNNKIIKNLELYSIHFFFFNKLTFDESNWSDQLSLFICQTDGQLNCYTYDTIQLQCVDNNVNHHVYRLEIPKYKVWGDVDSAGGKICYNVIINKNLYKDQNKDHWHKIGMKYALSNDTVDLGVMEFPLDITIQADKS